MMTGEPFDPAMQGFEDATCEAFKMLRGDDRVAIYASHLTPGAWREVLHALERATHRNRWDMMTNRERGSWKESFDATLTRLLQLMADAPTTPSDWGLPVRDMVLMNVLARVGVELPTNDLGEFWPRVLELEAKADEENWTLEDSLRQYGRQIDGDIRGEAQHVKKPRDAKAERADFIIRLRRHTNLPVGAIVALAQVAFDDESIDDRLVRRLTSALR